MSKRRELEAQRQAQERKQWITIAAIIAGIAVVVIGGAVILSNVSGDNLAANQLAKVLPSIKTTSAKAPPNAQPNELAWGQPIHQSRLWSFWITSAHTAKAFTRALKHN